jgi:hypothetical protein
VFPDNPKLILALLNSRFARYILQTINPTVNFQVGDLKRLPIPRLASPSLLASTDCAIEMARADSEEDETTYIFREPPNWPGGVTTVTARHRNLDALERDINTEVYRLYEISSDDRRCIEEELETAVTEAASVEGPGDDEAEAEVSSLSIEELAQRWVSYAVGIALGRFTHAKWESQPDACGLMIVQLDHPDDLSQRIIDILTAVFSVAEAPRIIRTAIGGTGDLRGDLASYLLGPFFKSHIVRYRKRPVYWLLQSPKLRFGVYVFHERASDQTLAMVQGNRFLGGRVFQVQQQLNLAKQKELTADSRAKAQWKQQAGDAAEELSDLEAFGKAIDETNSECVLGEDGQTAVARWVPQFDDGVLLNAAPLYRLTPAWKRADPKLDLSKVWKALKDGEFPWAKTAMRYWPCETLAACKDNKSYRIAHGLE